MEAPRPSRSSVVRKALVFGALLAVGAGNAQDLEQIGKKDPFTIRGGFGGSLTAYGTDLTDPRQVPFTWSINGRMEIGIYGLQLPFSFVISEKERDFRQPFNQYGISPRYKWVKAHLGHRTMHFSELTMSGQRFFGAGIELDPGKFRFAAMYGKLRREVFADTNTTAVVEPAYDRDGWAVRLGVGKQSSHVDLILFRAADRYDSAQVNAGKYGAVQPEENIVLGTDVAIQLAKGLQFELDAAASLNNVGTVPQAREGEGSELSNDFDSPLFNVDQRSRRGTAVRTGLSYNIKGVTISGKYDRIDPLFRTLGNYYFLTDIENYRGSIAWGMFKQKLRTSVSLGVQTNDLAQAYAVRTKRTIGSASVGYNSGNAYSLNLSYSNFEADLRSTYDAAGSDTLRLRQVAQSASLTQNLRFRNKEQERTRSFDLNISYQSFYTEATETQPEQRTGSYTGSIGYRIQLGKRHFSWGLRITGSLFGLADDQRLKYGFSTNVRKGFFGDKLGTNARFSFYRNQSSAGDSYSLVAGGGLDLRVRRVHRFGLGLNYNSRSITSADDLGQYQVSAQLTYGMTIEPRKKKSPNGK